MIYPSTTRQIRSTIANQNEVANYTFGFTLENRLPAGGFIEVTFPTQFPFGLGYNSTNVLKCSTPCTLVNRSVSFSFSNDLLPGVANEVSVYGVVNPPQKGGTGHFWIKSLKGGQYIDTNLLFGVIGFAGDIGIIKTATVSLEPKGVQYAGQLSKYVFTFITSRDIPDNNFVRLFLPRGEFGVAQFPSCAAYPVGGIVVRGRLTCEYLGDDFIDVSGFKDSFLAGTSIGIVVTLKNPPYAHITNNFGIAVMRKFTQIMYDRKLDIPGVTITKSQFKNVYIEQTDSAIYMTRNKIMEFRLHFTPTNILKQGSVIQLQFPASFKVYQETLLAQNVMFQVEFGLEDVSETNPLMIDYSIVGHPLTIGQ